MKTIILGDTHGTTFWKSIVEASKPDRVIFIGDYFDGYSKDVDEVQNFKDIIAYKKLGVAEVIILIGNHDHHYFPEVGFTGTSRYREDIADEITQLVDANRDLMQMAYQMDNVLCTHAGVTKTFMNQHFGKKWKNKEVADLLNKLFETNPHAFSFNGIEPTGDNITQTPIWVRPYSLVIDGIPGMVQIVGHTIQEDITSYEDIFFFIDTMQTTQEFLVYEDGQFSVHKLYYENEFAN